jgi:hypothetical protein
MTAALLPVARPADKLTTYLTSSAAPAFTSRVRVQEVGRARGGGRATSVVQAVAAAISPQRCRIASGRQSVAHLGSDMASQAAFGPQSAATYFH